ncbi:MAG: carbonate dehydratase [Pseudomonadota bacterium]|jgi:carbonic anhydrase
MTVQRDLFASNRAWAKTITTNDPDFFQKLSRQQRPEYLWIGCADSRVPANEIVGLLPGELFVHRNVANVVVHTDLNCLSVIQYAVEVLGIDQIIVTGHYGCGGVIAALEQRPLGLIDNWLRHIQDIHRRHEPLFVPLPDGAARANLLCELNVIEQVANVCQTTMVRDAWERGRPLTVRGWIYGLADGLLQDLAMQVTRGDDPNVIYRQAVAAAQLRNGC